MISVGHTGNYGGYDVEILELLPKHRVKIRFLSTGTEKLVYKINLQRGEIKDPCAKEIYGKACIRQGHNSSHRGYKSWMNMLFRCYNEEFHLKQPTYKDCYVSEGWLNFQNFAKWFDETYPGKGYQLDKDLKVKDNLCYSPNTCLWLPRAVNQFINPSKGKRTERKIGAAYSADKDKYEVRCPTVSGRRPFLGHYLTEDAAHLAYKRAKEKEIKILADTYFEAGLISEEVYSCLYNFEVKETD